MSRQLADLEEVLAQMAAENRKLLKQIDAHQAAMRVIDVDAMEKALLVQDATRLRLLALDHRRKALVQQIGAAARATGEMTLARVAEMYPQQGPRLLALRDELKGVLGQVAARNQLAGRISGAVLGHLNTVMRLVAGTVERAGVYTRQGTPRMSARIGVMEAVG